jgi:mannose-1-phosphate guanylyltransferase
MPKKTFSLVMAGGRGTRFWPESTEKKPKQYLNLWGKESLLEQTLSRLIGLVSLKNTFVVTVQEQEKLAKKNIDQFVDDKNLIFEPAGRNTAPCILLSLAHLLVNGASENDVVSIIPSDHVILNKKGFQNTLKLAGMAAFQNNEIITIGIRPHFPHTGYGYVERGEKKSLSSYETEETFESEEYFKVASFREKPTKERAHEYLCSGRYFWNAGMFISKIGVLLEEFAAHAPETYKFFSDLKRAVEEGKSTKAIYEKLPKASIDYAVMEKSKRVSVIPALFDWNDLGSWDALEDVLKPEEGNTVVKDRGHYFKEAKGNIVFAPGKFVSLVGVNDLVIVSNEKVLMVVPKSDSQKVKGMVEDLKKKKTVHDLL